MGLSSPGFEELSVGRFDFSNCSTLLSGPISAPFSNDSGARGVALSELSFLPSSGKVFTTGLGCNGCLSVGGEGAVCSSLIGIGFGSK